MDEVRYPVGRFTYHPPTAALRAEALADLDTRQPEGSPKPDLERMRALFDLLDDPQRTYPTIHVTGTNGKTTTSRLAAAIACAHGPLPSSASHLLFATFVSQNSTAMRPVVCVRSSPPVPKMVPLVLTLMRSTP